MKRILTVALMLISVSAFAKAPAKTDQKNKNNKENFKSKSSQNNFTFGKEFFKSAPEMKGMFENSFGLDKMGKNKAKAEKESVKSRFESFFDMKEKK